MNIGQRVVCVNDIFAPNLARHYRELPIRDHIYTIRHMEPGGTTLTGRYNNSTTAVLLEELHNPDPGINGGRELGFDQRRFSPIEAVTEVDFAHANNEMKTAA